MFFKLFLFALLTYLALRTVVRLVGAIRSDGLPPQGQPGRVPHAQPPPKRQKRAPQIEDARFRDV